MKPPSAQSLTPMRPGERLAYFEILEHLSGDRAWRMIYRVKRICCGIEETLNYKTMDAHRRAGVDKCYGCRTRGAPLAEDILWEPGQRLGPLTLIQRVSPTFWRVAWNCCGRETEFGLSTIKNYKRDWHRDRNHPCPACKRLEPKPDQSQAIVDLGSHDWSGHAELYTHLWNRPVPDGLRRDVWGHPG